MSRRTSIIVAALLLLTGLGVLCYPAISNYVNQVHGSYAIQELNDQMGQVKSDQAAQQRRLAEAYNLRLSGVEITDAFDEEQENLLDAYNDILDFGNGIMGYIQIPRINVSLPIYHGVSDGILAKAVGHLPQSAFPIGGEGNHAVLTGHTGLPSAELFTDLTELSEGDTFYINILEETLAYEVDQIKVVLPSVTEDLEAVAGEDYCTLVTCTPYGVNSHRLLVRGHRIELAQEEVAEVLQKELKQQTALPTELILAGIAAGVIMLIILIMTIKLISGKK